jgi:hypothetical protein
LASCRSFELDTLGPDRGAPDSDAGSIVDSESDNELGEDSDGDEEDEEGEVDEDEDEDRLQNPNASSS